MTSSPSRPGASEMQVVGMPISGPTRVADHATPFHTRDRSAVCPSACHTTSADSPSGWNATPTRGSSAAAALVSTSVNASHASPLQRPRLTSRAVSSVATSTSSLLPLGFAASATHRTSPPGEGSVTAGAHASPVQIRALGAPLPGAQTTNASPDREVYATSNARPPAGSDVSSITGALHSEPSHTAAYSRALLAASMTISSPPGFDASVIHRAGPSSVSPGMLDPAERAPECVRKRSAVLFFSR